MRSVFNDVEKRLTRLNERVINRSAKQPDCCRSGYRMNIEREPKVDHKFDPNSERGVSLIEILIVLVIAAILVTAAVTSIGGAKANLSRQNIAREFKISLERARFDSVKRHANDDTTMATVKIINATSYSVTSDLNQNGTIDVGETQVIDFSTRDGVTIVLPTGITRPVTISFDQLGHASVVDYNGLSTDHFLFCSRDCTIANATSSNSNVIYLSATGTVAMLGGSDSMPTISAPSVSSVANPLS